MSSSEPALTLRRLAGGTYRKVGHVGKRLLGGDAEAGADDHQDLLPDPASPPWLPLPETTSGALCNICRWRGGALSEPGHCERAHCPGCGSNARDRFLHWCLTERVDLHPGLRIIECSPRLGETYRSAMSTWFFYRTSDYDLGAHRGNIQLDLQAIDLPDGCVDVMLCAHVLEHVPDTDKALAELRRILAPGGHLLLQVPVLQAETAPPSEPEFHGDNTPVFWRFGFDLTARLRDHGFSTDLLCTQGFVDVVVSGENPWPEWSGEFDVPAMLAGAISEDLVTVADEATATRLGITPAYMFLTWDCTTPH